MTKMRDIKEIGDWGEEHAINVLTTLGEAKIATLSNDPYDSTKDLHLYNDEGLQFSVEVKTKTPIKKDSAFTFDDQQYKKLSSADFGIINGVYTDAVVTYKLLPESKTTTVRYNSTDLVAVKIKDLKIMSVFTDPAELERLNNLSWSNFKHSVEDHHGKDFIKKWQQKDTV